MTDGTVEGTTQITPAQAVSTEGLLTQDKANYLITKAKEHAYEQGRREAEAKVQPGMSQEQILDLIEKKSQEKIQAFHEDMVRKFEVNKVVESHRHAIEEGRKSYSDFDEQVGIFDFSQNPTLVRILREYPNSKDILYEIGQNPEKATGVYTYALAGQEKAAKKILDKISKSIEDNKAAQASAKTKAESKPLTQLKPSTASVGDGKNSYADIKHQLKQIKRR